MGLRSGGLVSDETSLVVDKHGLAQVMGEGPVYFVLGHHTPEVCEPRTPLTFSNFKIWKVPSSGTFDLGSRPAAGWSYLVSVANSQLSQNPYEGRR